MKGPDEEAAGTCWMMCTSTAPNFYIAREAVEASSNIRWPVGGGRTRVPTLLGLSIGISGAPLDIGPIHYVEQLVEPEKDVLPVMQICGTVWAVSGEFQRIIDQLEPGVHQFFPMTIRCFDGARAKGDYFIFNICQRIRAIDVDRSSLIRKTRSDGTEYFAFTPDTNRFIVRADAVIGKHVWRDDTFAVEALFCSDQMKRALSAAGFAMLEFSKIAVEYHAH